MRVSSLQDGDAGRLIASDAVPHPVTALHPDTRAQLMELAADADVLALKWGK